MGRKHCGKRRNCSLRAISPFPTVFFKRLVSKGRQNVSLCENGLSFLFARTQLKRLFSGSYAKFPPKVIVDVPVRTVKIFLKCELTIFQTERVSRRQFKFYENGRKFWKRAENRVGKGETAHYEQFLFFSQCFQKTCTADE